MSETTVAHLRTELGEAAVVASRWDEFLVQARGRFLALMRQVQLDCASAHESVDADLSPVREVWEATEATAQALDGQIADFWDVEIQRPLSREGAKEGTIERVCAQGAGLREWMEVERERVRVAIHGEAARAFLRRATDDNAGVPAGIQGPDERWLRALCEEAAWREWMVMKAADKTQREARPATIYLLKDLERAQLQYWRAYLDARARFAPAAAGSFVADLLQRMAPFYASLDANAAWVEAGRPRELSPP